MTNDPMNTPDEKPKTGIADFIQETRREVSKVTWPSRKEISMTTLLIVIFALVTGVFFLAIDSVLGLVVSKLLGMN